MENNASNLLPALDYSKKENWLINEEDKLGADYDLIFFCGTVIAQPGLPNGIGTDLSAFLNAGIRNYESVGGAVNDNARVFVPIQRQIALLTALTFTSHDALLEEIASKEPFQDLTAALDYYFEHYNKGAKRPFVIAGHSQGSSSCQVMLEHYFLKTEKREYLKNLVAIYALGYGVSKKWFNSLPTNGLIHFAEGAGDYNAIISWNVEGAGDKGQSFLLADPGDETLVINPINWKRDETYAPKEENKGVLMDDGRPLMEMNYFPTHDPKYLFDAQVDLKRGSVITTSCQSFIAMPGGVEIWGGKSLHSYDGRGYYFNLKENVRLRVNNFIKEKGLKKRPQYPNLVGEPLDYTKGSNWMIRQDNGDQKVDLFYLYPTAVSIKCKTLVSPVDQHMKFAALGNFERGPSLFDGMCNIFAPYYRQLTVPAILNDKTAENFMNHLYDSEVRTDTYAALDYYFENYNNGRPFILASHSQGSFTMLNILKEYMKLHPEYYERMICAYVLGVSVSKKYQDESPHVKFAQGEADLGVVISWNVEAPEGKQYNLPVVDGVINLINPLNWKTDETYAPISENKGSYDLKSHSVVDGVADAQLDLTRGVLVTKTPGQFGYSLIPPNPVFGDKSYHFDDWNFFYENIKENAKKRIDKYFKLYK